MFKLIYIIKFVDTFSLILLYLFILWSFSQIVLKSKSHTSNPIYFHYIRKENNDFFFAKVERPGYLR